jgi:hypothetical protein
MEVSTIHLLYHSWFWSWTKNQKLFIDIDYVMILFVQFSHLAWVQTDRKSGGLGDLKYPLISDVTKSISKSYGVLIPDQVRDVFINVVLRNTMNSLKTFIFLITLCYCITVYMYKCTSMHFFVCCLLLARLSIKLNHNDLGLAHI